MNKKKDKFFYTCPFCEKTISPAYSDLHLALCTITSGNENLGSELYEKRES